jgi:iron complex outermembrane receptor protein
MDRVPLNNNNTEWSAAYNLTNVSAFYDWKILPSVQVKFYAGINNVLDTKYTSYFSTNATSNKFYNPAPPRNYFGGLSLTWKMK